jgi:F-type H+-transporting ATPase subunit a
MTNLFSSFDPMVNIIGFNIRLNWISRIIPILILPQAYWITSSQIIKSIENIINYLHGELAAVFGLVALPGTIFTFLRFFFFIFFCNLIGLAPYIFTRSSHMSFTLTLALPIWLGRILFSMKNQYNRLFAHLVPTGTPGALIPVIVIIETVSNVIRPGTLSIRLAANIVAGHLLLTLLGSQGPNAQGIVLLVLIGRLILLLCLELAVACIQAYVFTILRSLYLNELRTVSFNKNIS